MTLISRRELLRSATRESHAELDALSRALDLTTLSDYRRFLLANAAPLAALETALEHAGVERLIADWRVRARRHALDQDLAMLGVSIAPMQAAALRSVSEHEMTRAACAAFELFRDSFAMLQPREHCMTA